jgi:transglutaminase-like putative cysteine protease
MTNATRTTASGRQLSARELLDREDPRDDDPDVPTRWVVLLAAAPTVAAALEIRILVQGIAWWWTSVVLVAILVGVLMTLRKRSRGARFVAVVVTLIAESCGTAIVNGIEPIGWLDRHGALGDTILAIRLNPAPLLDSPEIRLVVALAITWIAGAALFVAAISATPALAAAPALVILIVPGVITGQMPSTLLVVVTGLAFLGLLWVSVRPLQHAFPAIAVGGLSLALAVALPTLVPLNSGFLSTVTGQEQSPIQPGRPGTLLRLGQDLRQPSELEVFRYRTATGQPEYLKLADLDDFSSGDWVPTVQDASQLPSANSGQIAVGVNPKFATRGDAVIRITGLSSQYLPLPAGATSVSSQSTALDLTKWRWLDGANTVRSTGPLTRPGDTYQVDGSATYAGVYLDTVAADGGLSSARNDRFFVPPSAQQLSQDEQLPKNLPSIISSTAERIASRAGSTNQYDEARALQSYFLSGAFTYSETAPVEQGYDGDNMSVIAKFLKVKEGYCVHFASAMAVMARVLGIPSRIAVGYRPGASTSSGEYEVSNRQLHAWPELYIKGAGWVAFEPTPAATGTGTSTSTVTATPSVQATNTPLPAPKRGSSELPAPTASQSSAVVATGPGSGSGTGRGVLSVVLVILAAGALLLSPMAFRASRRRRRLGAVRAGRSPATNAWREAIDDVVDHGYAPGLAPPDDAAAVARTARAVLGRFRTSAPASVLPALEQLVDAVDRERFSADGSAGADRSRLIALVLEARRTLDASVSAAQVARSRLAPRSLAPVAPRARRVRRA